jgi:putative intracellular protease/amidase/quercetin dioxygenase-like cupin family protein
MNVLIVLTSNSKLGASGLRTGYWLEEFTAPYYALRDAGFEVTLASPLGGAPPVDPASLAIDPRPSSDARFLADSEAERAMLNTIPLARVSADDYDAVYYPGGHGVLWDLVEDRHSIRLIEDFMDAGKPTALVCHAPAALSHAKTKEGPPVVAGRRVNGTSNSEERASGLQDVVPFMLEDRLISLGGHYSSAADGQPHVVVDGNLITGQNPASALGVGLVLIHQLHGRDAIMRGVGASVRTFFAGPRKLAGLLAATMAVATGLVPVDGASGVVVTPTSPMQRELLQRTPIADSNLELSIYRITLRPAVSVDAHCHPAVDVGYVIDGEFESQFEGGPVETKHAGESFVDEAAEHVMFRNASATKPLIFLVTYVLPPGTPPIRFGASCNAPSKASP